MKKEILPFIGKDKVYKKVLSNGLTVLCLYNKIAPVFSYQTWYNVGSRDEVPGLSGIAHLFEHMMFKETKNLKQGQFDKTMESNGARDLNAFTSTDFTAYVQSLPIETFDLVASLEAERMVNLLLTKEQFESEREVVHNERKQRNENNPEGQMFEELQKLAFPRHPYGRPVIGWEEDLNRMTTVDCERFYDSYYAPNNAVIVVVGMIPPEKVFKIIEKHYGKFLSSEIPRVAIEQEPEQTEERKKIMPLALQVEKAYMGYRIPPAIHDDHIPLSVLSAVMTSGRSSRLYKALVDLGHTIDIGAGSGSAKDASLFYVSFSAHAGKKAEDAIAIIDREMEKFAHSAISEEEMKRAKNKLRTEFHMGLSSNAAKANFIGQNQLVFDDYTVGLKAMDEIAAVKKEEVQRVAKKYFQAKNRSIVLGIPSV